MLTAPTIDCDQERLRALQDLNILDTPQDEHFDRITRLAADLFNVSTALVSLVDENRQWFKSRQGLDATETPRDISFCGHAIAGEDIFVVEDASKDPRFSDNPLVTDAPHIRFYAGYPLRTVDGYRVGTLCLIDEKPRAFTTLDRARLRDLGVMVETELRKLTFPKPQHSNLLGKWPELNRYWQKTITTVSSVIGASLISLCTAAFISTLAYLWDQQQLENHKTHIINESLQRMTLVRGTIETALNSKLHLVHGLSGYVRANSAIDEAAFDDFAGQLAFNISNVSSLQLAPGGIVSFVWPYAGNQAAIGHDLLADVNRRQAAQAAIESRQMWIAGPLELIQGGLALIGRQPIFTQAKNSEQQDDFWGFATILIDLPGFLSEVDLNSQDDEFQYALRGRNAMGNEGEVFFGSKEVFELSPVSGEITLPAGAWVLGVVPVNGWPVQWPGQLSFRIGSFILTLLITALLYFLLRLPHSTRKAIENATAALSRSELRFRDAIESLPDGVVIYDRDDRLAVFNENFRGLYPKIEKQLRYGTRYRDLLQTAVKNNQFDITATNPSLTHENFLDKALDLHEAGKANYDVRLIDGRWIHVVERRMRDGGTVCFHLDVTGQKTNEQALIDSRVRAETANEAKSTFLATVSHEVRTPLNGVMGLLSVLRDNASLSPRDSEYVATAHQSAQQLLSILNEILDISKMEAGKLTLEPGVFNFRDTVLGAIDLIKPQANSKALLLNTDIPPECGIDVIGDEGRIRQILLNLLSNAVKFTEQGSISVNTSVRIMSEKQVNLSVSVADSGIGFSPEQAESLFEPFAQLDTKSTRTVTGTGLGLAICKSLIESMNGDIVATGTPGEGAKFTISLALEKAAEFENSGQAGQETIVLPKDAGWPKIRVLLAEDSTTNQMVIRAMLDNTGYQLDCVNDGNEAVITANEFPYDLVLMDIYMPNMDGVEATREIRKKMPQGKLPIIAITANAMSGDREKFLAAGMDDFLSKPVNKILLLKTLHKWISPHIQQSHETN